mmetsp:Transcript_90278/g.260295  ORF Transcript_90278/g.260295 Transcript_90278/m.260295 type:complete len:207 (-) Transcript_90278:369-989(-)
MLGPARQPPQERRARLPSGPAATPATSSPSTSCPARAPRRPRAPRATATATPTSRWPSWCGARASSWSSIRRASPRPSVGRRPAVRRSRLRRRSNCPRTWPWQGGSCPVAAGFRSSSASASRWRAASSSCARCPRRKCSSRSICWARAGRKALAASASRSSPRRWAPAAQNFPVAAAVAPASRPSSARPRPWDRRRTGPMRRSPRR